MASVPEVVSSRARIIFKRSRIFQVILLALSVSSFVVAHAALAHDLWFAPSFPFSGFPQERRGPLDYMSLFDDPKSWPETIQHIKVFKIYQGAVHDLSDQQLSKLIAVLRSRNVRLAIEYGVMTPSAECGRGVEGYFGEFLSSTLMKLKRLGGEVSFLAMDEPLWYGVDYSRTGRCNRSIKEVAQDVARHVAEARAVYPNIAVGDVEPFPQSSTPNWPEQLQQWSTAFRNATGSPLAFEQADVVWTQSWQGVLRTVATAFRAQGIACGVVINGNGTDQSDQAWVQHALDHAREAELLGVPFDQIVIQSWQRLPSKVGPEWAEGSMSNLVLQFLHLDEPGRR